MPKKAEMVWKDGRSGPWRVKRYADRWMLQRYGGFAGFYDTQAAAKAAAEKK